MSKRFIALLVFVAALLAACGGGGVSGSASDTATANTSGGTSAETGSSGQATDSGPVTLTVWDYSYFEGDNLPGLKAIDEAFMKKYPDIKIDHVGVPYNTAFEKYRAAIAARSGPDLVSLYPGAFAAEYRRGLLPVDDRITDEQRSDLIDLEGSRAPDGHFYAMPWTVYGFVYFYNEELFAKAGITTPPTTWDELLADCGKLRAAGIQPISAGWKDGYYAEWFQFIFLDMLLDKESASQFATADVPMDDPRMVQGLRLLQDMEKAGCFADGAESRTLSDIADAFAGGMAAITLDLAVPDKLETYAETIGRDNIGTFAPPLVPGSAYSSPLIDLGPNGGYAITNWTESPDAAWTYLSFLLSPEAQELMWTVNRRLPNNRKVEIESDWPTEQEMLDLLKLPDNHSVYLGFPSSVIAVMERQAAALVSGAASAEAVAGDMEEAMAKVRRALKG